MKLKLTHEAIDDINEIRKYIRKEYDNPAAATRIAGKIIEAYKLLKTMPFMGTLLRSRVDFATNVRYVVSGNYLIFYIGNNAGMGV